MPRWLQVTVTSEVRVVAIVLLRGLAGSARRMRGRPVHRVPPSLSAHTNCQGREMLPLTGRNTTMLSVVCPKCTLPMLAEFRDIPTGDRHMRGKASTLQGPV